MANQATILIGIGHIFRADDALGLWAVREVKGACQKFEHHGEGLGLIELWRGAAKVIVVDAIMGGIPGSIICLNGWDEIPDLDYRSSSHVFGLAQAINLAKEIGAMPDELRIYGIVGENFKMGEEMTPVVKAALSKIIRQIEAEL